jgi:hypothetical protein
MASLDMQFIHSWYTNHLHSSFPPYTLGINNTHTAFTLNTFNKKPIPKEKKAASLNFLQDVVTP